MRGSLIGVVRKLLSAERKRSESFSGGGESKGVVRVLRGREDLDRGARAKEVCGREGGGDDGAIQKR